MKGLIVVAMVSAILLPTHSAAHGMGAAGMGRGVGFSGNFGRGPNRAGFGRKRNGFGWSRGVSYFGECVDMGWDCDWYRNSSDYGYPANYGEGYASGLNIIMTPFQQAPVEPPPPPPSPVQSEMREYHWPSSGSDPGAPFSIVLKDGTVYRATTLWVQDNTVCFIAPDGTGGQVSVSSVNREDTQRANAALHLAFRLAVGPSMSTGSTR